jgi:hypothetical protein
MDYLKYTKLLAAKLEKKFKDKIGWSMQRS